MGREDFFSAKQERGVGKVPGGTVHAEAKEPPIKWPKSPVAHKVCSNSLAKDKVEVQCSSLSNEEPLLTPDTGLSRRGIF